MNIPYEHKERYIFHFTDISNLDSIIKEGLLCTNLLKSKGIEYRNIANSDIQNRRAHMNVTSGPRGKVHDYVPFYFSSINPMLLTLLNKKNIDQHYIIYLCLKIQHLCEGGAVFTDASANTENPPKFYSNVSDLDKLDWNLIDSFKWNVGSDDAKHKKMAEALIYKVVTIDEIDSIVVFNESAKECVEQIFKSNGITPPTILYDGDESLKDYHFYYTKFFIRDQRLMSLVTGPKLLLQRYKNLVDEVVEARENQVGIFRYKDVSDLVADLKEDISVLPELKEIIDLQQDYPPHNDTLDDHTRNVVANIEEMIFYRKLPLEKKSILLLAAYLHDVGKGPKVKWQNGSMTRPYPDHPADAIPMLKRILTEDVANISREDIRRISMLVVYHDLIGDIICNERDIKQALNIIENEEDLEMLFAISSADARSISVEWNNQILHNKKELSMRIMKLKNSES